MNKFLQKVAKIFLGISMAAGVGVAITASKEEAGPVSGANVTASWSAADEGFTYQEQVGGRSFSFDDSNVTISFGEASGNGHKWYSPAIRSYGGNTFTIASTGGNLKSITLSNDQSKTVTASVGTYSNNSWTGDAASVTFTVASGSGNFRTSTVSVTYSGGVTPAKVLSSVSSSGHTTSFTEGNKFSYGGTLTATYTDSTTYPNETVTPTAFKFNSMNDSTAAGTSITTDTTMSVSTHNGKYVFVGYTLDQVTKWSAGYQITVSSPVAATGISLDPASVSMEQGEQKTITATVTPNNASDKSVTWSVSPTDQGVTVSDGVVSSTASATTGNYTVTASANGGSNITATCTVTVKKSSKITLDPTVTSSFPYQGITLSLTAGTLTNGTDYRVYKNGTLTITSTAGDMAKIELTYTGAANDGGGWSSSYSPNDDTWTSPTASGEQARITKIIITLVSIVEATGISFDEDSFEIYCDESFSFTPTLTGGSGSYEKTINWTSSNTSIIPNPSSSEDGEEVTLSPNAVQSNTSITITGTVASPGSATGSVSVTVKPARTIDHYSVTGTPTATVGGSWNLSACELHAWYDDQETEEKTLVKGTDYSLSTSTAVGQAGDKDVVLVDSLSKVSGSWTVTGTVVNAPVESTITIDTSNTNQVTTNGSEQVVFTEGVVTFTISKNTATSAANNYLGQGDNGTRVYSGTSLTVSVSGTGIYLKTVVFNKSVNGNNAIGNIGTSDWTGGTAESDTGKITVTASSNVQTVSHTSEGKGDIGSVVVTYEAPYQAVTGISLNKNSITMTSYDEERIIASALPVNASVPGVTFSGYDAEIISVDSSGNIIPTGTKFGPTTITITSNGYMGNNEHATSSCYVNITRATFKEAKYTYESSSTVTSSGDLITGSSATYSSTGTKFGLTDHLTDAKGSVTLTISGMEGYIVQSVVMKMKSYEDAGSASFSVTAGSTILKTISSAAFSDSSWYGSYSSDNVLMKIDMTNDEYEIQQSENLVISFNTTVSGFYMTDYRVRYVKAAVDTSAVDFAVKILTELTCTASGTSAPDVDEWAALETYYLESGQVTAAAKITLYEAAAADRDYDPLIDTTDAQKIAAAMAKYDYVVGKYNKGLGLEDDYPDFINRNPAPIGGQRIGLMHLIGVSNTNTVTIIVIISMVSVTAIGGYFFLRRRKEQ